MQLGQSAVAMKTIPNTGMESERLAIKERTWPQLNL